MGRALIAIGIVLVIIGLAWPWITRLGLGRLPGDTVMERDSFRFYFPITTSIIISLLLSVIIWLFRR